MIEKVSVIIPFYNRADWLCDAVESVLNQTYSNFEIIVINDGSSESIDDFLSKYGTKIIYKFKENGGPASARNLALTLATGDYIAFLDSDDVWLVDKTTKQISFMNQCGALWSHTGYLNWYPEIDKHVIKKNADDYGDVYFRSFISLRANTPAIIIKRECFEMFPDFIFAEKMRIGEDSALWTRISEYYPLALVEEPLIKVRQRGTNADLLSLLRFQSKTVIFKDIKLGIYNRVPHTITFIYQLYYLGSEIINFFQNRIQMNEKQLEFLGKLLWVIPFSLERLYLPFLKKYRLKHFKLKWEKMGDVEFLNSMKITD